MKKLTVVIPNRVGETPELTIKTLFRQDFTDFDVVIINDSNQNANAARNRGLKFVQTPYVLFSDNDINWLPGALTAMYNCLEQHPGISFAWGAYELNGKIWCNQGWNPEKLKHRNYISTMSMVRTEHHPGWDEKIRRLQDWDVWLTMMKQGHVGRNVGRKIFTTPVRDGITRNSITWEEALNAIRKKHSI